MGNTQPRKRKAVEEEVQPPGPAPKKRKFEEGDDVVDEYRAAIENGSMELVLEWESRPSTSSDPPRKRLRLSNQLSKLFSFSSSKINGESSQDCSVDGGSHPLRSSEYDSPASSSSSNWPVPWLESLFLPEFPNRNTITENNFYKNLEIGRGAFGKVFRVVSKKDTRGIYALKIMDKTQILAKKAIDAVKREVKIQKILGAYTFTARLFSCWQSRDLLFCLQQIADGHRGDLFKVWRDFGPFPEETVRLFAAEFACALDYMHRKNIIYRDLKLENVVTDADGHILIVDFGLAKEMKPGAKTRTICGTLQYMAPEVCSGVEYGHWVDWWSMAVLLHILFTNRYPYPNADVAHHSDLAFVDYSTPPSATRYLGNFLDRLLSVNPQNRMCYFEVIHAHEFFQGMDFQAVEQRRYPPLACLAASRSVIGDRESESSEADHGFERMFDEEYQDFDYINDAMHPGDCHPGQQMF